MVYEAIAVIYPDDRLERIRLSDVVLEGIHHCVCC